MVFDVGNNRFRLIGRVNYRAGIIYVLRSWTTRNTTRIAGRIRAGATCRRPVGRTRSVPGENEGRIDGDEVEVEGRGVSIPYAMPDTYYELVRGFPLARIRDDSHLAAAHEVLERLLVEDLDEGGQEYLDALTDHVASYEDQHVTIPEASEAEVLRELISANRLTQSRLAKEVGITQSTISAVLAGDRSFTRDQVLRVAARFGLPPTVFLRGGETFFLTPSNDSAAMPLPQEHGGRSPGWVGVVGLIMKHQIMRLRQKLPA